ncbi:hypothetical protein GGF31_008641 [Allomyces arbusculus]|nr:hypothetical protein GGF31_008641 [Allomyces arbusculus]
MASLKRRAPVTGYPGHHAVPMPVPGNYASSTSSTSGSDFDDAAYLLFDEKRAVGAYKHKKNRNKCTPRSVAFAGLAVFAALFVLAYFGHKHAVRTERRDRSEMLAGGNAALLSDREWQHGLAKCRARAPTSSSATVANRINPRDASNGVVTVIRNATVWDGRGGVFPATDVLLKDGLIAEIGADLEIPEGAKVVDAHGRVLTPGIVDMHSHAGVDSYPTLEATDDTNEYGNPNLPHVRSIDAFNPRDKALPLILSGGVTTILVLPGSANLMGGEAYAFKTPLKPSNNVEDMLLHANITEDNAEQVGGPQWRWAKHACGENPKHYGRDRSEMPYTRMGSSFLARSKYEQAAALRDQQDEWCRIAELQAKDAAKFAKYHSGSDKRAIVHPKGRFPESIELEQVVAILRGQIKVNWHCYTVNDIVAQMRIAREFNFSIAAFHHALDMHAVTPAFKKWEAEGREPIGAAIFSDHWGFKAEAYQGSVYAPQILNNAGIQFAFKSDHPVLHSQFLVHESARSIQYGLDEQTVIKALTSIPAKLMGVDHRVGSVAVNMDADVVLWPAHPFAVGAMPDAVFVDGAVAYENPIKKLVTGKVQDALDEGLTPPAVVSVPGTDATSAWFKNVGRIVTGDAVRHDQQVVVIKGKVACVAADCSSVAPAGAAIVDVRGGVITPSLVLAGTTLGLVEIVQEKGTTDGTAVVGPDMIVYGKDALQAGGKLEAAAHNQGIGLIISPPQVEYSSGIAFSVSAVAATGHDIPVIVDDEAAVHTWVNSESKKQGSPAGSIAGQIGALRRALQSAGDGPLARVVAGKLPLVIHTDSANHVAAVLGVKRDVDPAHKQQWVIAGGAEAHLAVDLLAASPKTSVLLSPARCIPKAWDARRCLSPPHEFRGAVHAAKVLRDAGVRVALATYPKEISHARNLRFDAGWVRALAGWTEQEMVRAVSTEVLDLLTGREDKPRSVEEALQLGGVARFNVWNGNLGELKTQLVMFVDGVAEEGVLRKPVHVYQ